MKNYFFFLFTLILCISCEKEEFENRTYPRVETLRVSSISAEGAVFEASLEYSEGFDIESYGFVWSKKFQGLSLEQSTQVVITENLQSDSFQAIIRSGLEDNFTYQVAAFVRGEGKTIYGFPVLFKSKGSESL